MKIRLVLAAFLAATLFGAGCAQTPPTPVNTVSPAPATTVLPSASATPTAMAPVATATSSNPSVEPAPSTKHYIIARPYLTDNPPGTTTTDIGCDGILFRKFYLSDENVMRPADTLLKEIFSFGGTIYEQEEPPNGIKTAEEFGLSYQNVAIAKGLATVRLVGQYHSAGECDDPRVPGIIEAALCQFPSVSSVRVLVNDKPFNFTDLSGRNLPAKDIVCNKKWYEGLRDYLNWTPPGSLQPLP